MTINVEYLLHRRFPEVRHPYDRRDVMLYALSLGLGSDPLDERQLRFVYEEGLRVFPTMAATLAYPGLWVREPDTGIDWEQALHGEPGVDFLRPMGLRRAPLWPWSVTTSRTDSPPCTCVFPRRFIPASSS